MVESKINTTFALAIQNDAHLLRRNMIQGTLVQLVRMPACHAGGHEFESRTHRGSLQVLLGGFFRYISLGIAITKHACGFANDFAIFIRSRNDMIISFS